MTTSCGEPAKVEAELVLVVAAGGVVEVELEVSVLGKVWLVVVVKGSGGYVKVGAPGASLQNCWPRSSAVLTSTGQSARMQNVYSAGKFSL